MPSGSANRTWPESSTIASQLTAEASALAPEILPYEVGNALSAMVNRRKLVAAEALEAKNAVGQIPVRLVAVDVHVSLQIAVEHNIYAYDAYFLQCARAYSCPVLTLDRGVINTKNSSFHTVVVEFNDYARTSGCSTTFSENSSFRQIDSIESRRARRGSGKSSGLCRSRAFIGHTTPKLSCRRSGRRPRTEPEACQGFGRSTAALRYVLFPSNKYRLICMAP